MFQESNYETKEFSIAPSGMNQFISPDSLPSNFCYLLENIIPSPLGVGQARYGNSFVHALPTTEFNIIRSLPFTLNGSVKQAILYVSYYSQDLNTNTMVAVDASHITFNSVPPANYVNDTKVKIVYTFNTIPNVLYADIKVVSITGNAVSITLENNILPDPTTGALVITQIWFQAGSIYSYNFNTDTLSAALKTGLSIGCVPRASYFQQKMIICNGVDNVMSWDGAALIDVAEFIVEDQVNTLTRIDNTHFSFNKLPAFNTLKYFIGNLIQLRIDGVLSTFTISNIVTILNIVTITTAEVLPAFGANAVTLFYQDKPPAFSYIYVAKDRIWALGPGPVSLEYRSTEEQLKVYYSFRPNSIGYGWFDETKKSVPFIIMADKCAFQDNFEAICQVNGFLAFMGRKHTQIWSGDTPGSGGNIGNFIWHSNLPVGIFHGDLLIEISNNVYFISQSGVQSFTTLNIGNQFSATADNAVDTIVKKFIFDANLSNTNYRKCTSFKYEKGWIAGFKISGNKILASLFSTNLYSWFYLSGDFSKSNCFIDLEDQFYMCVYNKIYKYRDGVDGTSKVYGDQDGTSLIPITWIPALVKFSNKKGYANKRYELSVNYPSSFSLNKDNSIEVSIFGDEPRSFSLSDKYNFNYRGDLIGQEPITVRTNNDPEGPGFRLRKEYETVNKRLKFKASSFWISVSGYVINGPVTLRNIKLFGVVERNA